MICTQNKLGFMARKSCMLCLAIDYNIQGGSIPSVCVKTEADE